MTIYNDYRPHSFDDVIGQKHVVHTLKSAIGKNLIGHAYLFTGPRGTGKTTLGRIFAHAVNCTPRDGFTPADAPACDAILSGTSLDIIEIDAASHTSVDNIRDLRETVAIPPSRTHYKVYIIDEAHMLSTAAWNAFLKTLEEPPAHAMFIFATTEVHKVPETILSRVQRFDLSRISIADVSEKLLMIAKAENKAMDAESAQMIAIASGGSMRDAESLLAQVMSFTTDAITPEDVRTTLGITTRDTVFTLLENIVARDTAAALRTLASVVDAGHNLSVFSTSLLTTLRHMLLVSISDALFADIADYYDDTEQSRLRALTEAGSARIIEMIDALAKARTEIATSAIPQLPLEVAVIRLTADLGTTGPAAPETTAAQAQAPAGAQQSTATPPSSDPLQSITQSWPQVIAAVKTNNSALAALLRHSAPHSLSDDTLTLVTTQNLLIEKIADNTLRLTLQNAIATICGMQLRLTARVVDETPSNSLIATAMQMMNGGRIA